MSITRIRALISAHLLLVFTGCDVTVPLGLEPVRTGPPIGVSCEEPRTGNPRELAGGQDAPRRLVVDDKYIYWVNQADEPSATGTITRIAKAGGEPEVLASHQAVPEGIALDDDAVYWIARGVAVGNGQLMRVPKAGGEPAPQAVALATYGTLAVDDQNIYLSDRFFVESIPKAGGAPQVIAQLNSPAMLGIAIDDRRVYFTDMAGGSVRSVAKVGGEAAAFTRTCTPGSVAAVDGYIYWTACLDVSLFRAPSAGDPAVALVPGKYAAHDFAVTSEHVYFATVGGFSVPGGIYRLPRAGGDIEMVTGGGCGYWGIAVDATSVYFTNRLDGTVNAIDR